jgi:hypothetical protein
MGAHLLITRCCRYVVGVNVAETLLVFVGAPLAVVVLLALLIFLPGGRGRTRYKSGQPWEHAPVWYEPHPEHGPPAGGHADGHGETRAIGSSMYGEPTGGDGHGRSAHDAHGATSAAPRPVVSAGPLGGARGTW